MAWSNPAHVHEGYRGPQKNCPICKREKRNGNRRAERDRDDSRSGGSPHLLAGGGPIDPNTIYTFVSSQPIGVWSNGQIVHQGQVSSPFRSLHSPDESSEKPPLPEREESMPIISWKWANLTHQGGFAFTGIGQGSGHRYKGTAVAECRRGGGYTFSLNGGIAREAVSNVHAAPHPGCLCGWHGLASPADPAPPAGYQGHPFALLDVEFYGRVIIHDKGYRAEKQRVLAAHLPAKCEFCVDPAIQVVIRNGYSSDSDGVAVRCATHLGPWDVPVTVESLAAELGCPVKLDRA